MNYKKLQTGRRKLEFAYIIGFLKSMFIIGILNKGRSEYWKFFVWTLFRRPGMFMIAIIFAVYGYHFRTVYGLRKGDTFRPQ